jgi:hypothetical protein
VARREADAQEVFVVAEFDVVARVMLLDERVLEDRRFLLGRGDDGVEITDRLLENGDEVTLVGAGGLKVTADPTPQALRLPDVDDDALLVLEEVDARLHRQSGKLFLDPIRQHLGVAR